MAMNTAVNKGVQASINMTPMIDILLVLLIIFLSIAPTRSGGLDALVPQPSNGAQASAPENPIVLEIAADGSYRVNTQLLSASALREMLTEVFARRNDRVLFVKAAPELEFRIVAAALDEAHAASIDRVALLPKESPR